MLRLHPNNGMEHLETKVHNIPEDTIGASGGQFLFGRI